MVATCKEKGCELKTEMQKIFGSLSIFVVEVWTRPMACITLVIAAPPHSLAYARETEKQNNHSLLLWIQFNDKTPEQDSQLLRAFKSPEHLLLDVNEHCSCECSNCCA